MNYRCLFLLGTAIALAGCAKEPVPAVVPEDPNLIPLNIDGSINQIQTKVNAAGFVDKDALGLFAVNYSEENTVAGTLADNGNQADNVKYVFDEAANKWTPTKKVYYKDVNTNVDLYLYYPHQSSVTEVNAANFEVQKDQSSAATASSLSGYEASDFLWGKAVNITPSENKVAVQLSHKMAAVNVVLVEKEGFAEGEFASLEKGIILTNTTRKAKINFATGEVSALGNAQQDGIVMCPQSSGSFRAVVVPQTVEAGEKLFAITIDGVSYGFRNSAASVTYAAGKQTDVTINIKKKTPAGEYELTLGDIKIADWTEDRNTHGGEARQYFVVNLTEAGTLGKVIRSFKKNPDKIRNLKVSGPITTEDFYFMRDSMAILEAINLKEAKVVNARFDYYNHDKIKDDVIPYEAFNNKKTLSHFSFPEKITYIGSYAFYNTSLSGALIIPDDVTEIGQYAFRGTLIGNVSFSPRLNKIEEHAFNCCTSLTGTLTLPESLTYIGMSAFEYCSFTGELHLPNDLDYIGVAAFANAGSFVGNLRFPDKIKSVPDNAFSCCGFTGQLNLNNAVEFGSNSFSCCNFSGDLIIPEGTIEIPDYFMSFYTSPRDGRLSNIIFPKSLRRIKESAFYRQSSLKIMSLDEGVVSIGESAFFGANLTSLKLPSSIQTINKDAFENCYSLSNITCYAVDPPAVMQGAFNGVAKDNFTVEVPAQSVTRYKTESGWSDFRRIAAHYDFSISRDRVRTLNAAESRTLVLRAPANFNWSIESKPDWVTVTPASGTGKADITVSVNEMARTTDQFEVNEGTFNSPIYKKYAGRSGEIIFRLEDKDYTCTLDVEQYDTDYSDGEVVTLNTATKGPGIDIVFIGDGYDAKDIAKGTFKQNTEDGFKHFFGIEPYSTYKDYFNVYAVVSKSDDSGIGTVNTVIDTKFGSYFTQNRIKAPAADKCFTWAKRADASMDLSKSLVIMLMNTSTYEGVTMMYGDGSAIACCPVSTDAYPYDFRGIIQHEAGGHGFGKLGDEYIYHNAFIQTCQCIDGCEHPQGDDDMSTPYGVYKSKGWFKNLSMTADAKQVPWAHLIYHKNYSDKVDMYEGGYMHTRGVYRSEATSCMNNNIPYYSAISRQAIVERIKAYAGEAFDFDDFVAKDSFEVGTKSLARDFDWTFGVNPNMFRANGDGPIYMGEHPNVK
ncbi:MAG: leucine-rich repeat protein [Bacteroidales bacterium]|nr:leucine-rich repeat protein [Bacteroidales bacterium]